MILTDEALRASSLRALRTLSQGSLTSVKEARGRVTVIKIDLLVRSANMGLKLLLVAGRKMGTVEPD